MKNGCGCKDTDSGLNYFDEGEIYVEDINALTMRWIETYCRSSSRCIRSGVDTCMNSTYLKEYYCETGGVANRTIRCPAGCSNGACICPDSDSGENYYLRGSVSGVEDYCLDPNVLREYTCGMDERGNLVARGNNITCPFGCSAGACVCRDDDGGINYEVRGRIGTHEDYCMDDDRTLREYYAILDRGRCYDSYTDHRCEGACGQGRCLPPTCNDGIRDQGEDDIDCGGPCTACGYVKISGSIKYEEVNNSAIGFIRSSGFKPARFITVGLGSYTGLTDSNGYFEFVIPIRAGAEYRLGVQSINYAARVERDFDGCNEFVSWQTDIIRIPERGDVDFGELKVMIDTDVDFRAYWWEPGSWCWSEGEFDGGSGYFNIAETLLLTRQYADANRADSDSIGRVDVAYPDRDWPKYSSTWGEIYLPRGTDEARDFGFVDETIIHEYGHHLEAEISENDDYWGSPDHGFCSQKDEEFAWKEGFPDYLSAFLTNRYRNITNPHFLSQERTKYHLIEPGNCVTRNWEVEGMITALLWDLVDAPGTDYPNAVAEPFDTISGEDRTIFYIFDTEMDNYIDAPDVCEFVFGDSGWKSRFRGDWRGDAIDLIRAEYNIGC